MAAISFIALVDFDEALESTDTVVVIGKPDVGRSFGNAVGDCGHADFLNAGTVAGPSMIAVGSDSSNRGNRLLDVFIIGNIVLPKGTKITGVTKQVGVTCISGISTIWQKYTGNTDE